MNNPQVFSDSENHQPSLISHYNPQDNDTLTSSPLGQETENFRSNENTNQATHEQHRNFINDNSQIQPFHSTIFFYRPPNHFYHYRVNCEEISYDAIEGLLNDRNFKQHREDEYVFFYQ